MANPQEEVRQTTEKGKEKPGKGRSDREIFFSIGKQQTPPVSGPGKVQQSATHALSESFQ